MLTRKAKSEKIQDKSDKKFHPNRGFPSVGLISADFNVYMKNPG